MAYNSKPTLNGKTFLYARPGEQLTLAWQYDGDQSVKIARDSTVSMTYYTIIAEGITDLSYTVTAPLWDGASYYFAIIGMNGYFSEQRAGVQAAQVMPSEAPAAALSAPVTLPGTSVVISWPASTPGAYAEVVGYQVQRATSADFSDAETVYQGDALSAEAHASETPGTYVYFRVRALGVVASGNSTWCAPIPLLANTPIVAPDITTGGITHNPRPRILARVGEDAGLQTVTAPGFISSSPGGTGSFEGVILRKSEAASMGAHTVTVTVRDPYNGEKSATAYYTYTPIRWTDDPIIAGNTVIKAAHINELRDALENACLYYGIDLPVWGEPIIAGETSSARWPAHVRELQDTVRRIVQYINSWDTRDPSQNVILPAMPEPRVATAEIINQLRQIVITL